MMKLAFPPRLSGWSWEEIYATCKDLGIDGIEVRGIGSEICTEMQAFQRKY